VRLLRQGGYDVFHERVDSAESLTQALEKPWDIVISVIRCPMSAERTH
jgi:hypothetical protein